MTITVITPPTRSREQRLNALARANAVRADRARLKRDLKAGRCSVVDLLSAPAEDLGTMKVFELLVAAPKIGRVKAGNLLARGRVSPTKTIGGMTERQRLELVAMLGRRSS